MITLKSILAHCRRVGECLEWTGLRNQAGYGKIYMRNPSRMEYAHRAVAFALGWPVGNQHVLHKCDNPSCCNPAHLFIGTPADNVHDAMIKGRHVPPPIVDWPNKMEQQPHHWQILSRDDVVKIRARLALGEKLAVIAKDFGVSFQQISKIKLGHRWAHFK